MNPAPPTSSAPARTSAIHIGDATQPEHSARAGLGVSPPSVLSHFAPNTTGGRSTLNGIFVGRFTIKAGATLSGGIYFNTFSAPGEYDGHDLVLGGAPVLFNTHNGTQFLALRAYQLNRAGPIDLANPSAATFEGIYEGTPFGAANLIDLWVQVVPAPGTLFIAPIMLVLSVPRRRG